LEVGISHRVISPRQRGFRGRLGEDSLQNPAYLSPSETSLRGGRGVEATLEGSASPQKLLAWQMKKYSCGTNATMRFVDVGLLVFPGRTALTVQFVHGTLAVGLPRIMNVTFVNSEAGYSQYKVTLVRKPWPNEVKAAAAANSASSSFFILS